MIYSLFSHLPNFFTGEEKFPLTPWPFSQLPKLYTLKIPSVHLREKASSLTSLTSCSSINMHLVQQIYKQSVPECSSSGHGRLGTALLLQRCPPALTPEGPIVFSRHSLKESETAFSSLVSKASSNFQYSTLQSLQLCPLSAESNHARTLHPRSLSFYFNCIELCSSGTGLPLKKIFLLQIV